MDSPPGPQFGAVYETHSSYVRAIARRLLKDPAEVEDIHQEVFLQAWRQFDRFDPARGDVRAWLTVITRTRAIDRLRRRARLQQPECPAVFEGLALDADPRSLAELAEATARIRSAWVSLPPLTKQVLELVYRENLSQRDIAQRVGETLGVVKSRLRQGLLALRAHVNESGGARARQDDREWALTTTDLEPSSTAGPAFPSLTDLHVMVVDDDASTREVLGALLRRAGALPLLQASAADACRTLRDVWPDVLVADIVMPGQDGYALMRRVQTIASRANLGLPAIAFTARAGESDRARALNAGFQMHLSKPVHPVAVLSAIRRLADERSGSTRA